MKIAVVGAGGVGGGYGAALAKAGADLTFIARGAHLEAMKNKGLRLESPRGDIHLVPTQATDDPKTVGPVDIVLFCVKLWDVESAGAAIKPMVAANTAVIPLQNGVDAADRLAPILGRQAVMGGVANISATIAEPGVIRQTGTVLRIIRRARRHQERARRSIRRPLRQGWHRRCAVDVDTDRALDEVHSARLQRQPHGAGPPARRQAAR
jgi:2-dehydropantoate 2-reductase